MLINFQVFDFVNQNDKVDSIMNFVLIFNNINSFFLIMIFSSVLFKSFYNMVILG
jgi:hypothetical protein